MSVGFSGSGDRPDFEAFTNYVGDVYDIDDSRDSIAVAPATCVRMFDGKHYRGDDSGLLCAPAGADGLFADLGAMTNRASSMRVCPLSVSRGCDAAPAPAPVPVPAPPLPPAPAPNGSPASQDARLSATLVRRRARRTVSFVAPRRRRRIRARRCRRAPSRRRRASGAHARTARRLAVAGGAGGHHGRRRNGADTAGARPLAHSAAGVPRGDRGRAARGGGSGATRRAGRRQIPRSSPGGSEPATRSGSAGGCSPRHRRGSASS